MRAILAALPKLSDNQVHDRMHAALAELNGEAETVRGRTALEAARRALAALSLGLLYAAEQASDDVPGIMKVPPTEE